MCLSDNNISIGEFDVWHDRAVFHFLTDITERQIYINNLVSNLSKSGVEIIGTFTINGATSCCGLDIVQYDAKKMINELSETMKLSDAVTSTHVTPNGSIQEYMYFMISHK